MYQGSACIYRVVIHKRVPKHIVNQAKVFIVEFKALWPYACALGMSIKVALLLPYCAFIASLVFESPPAQNILPVPYHCSKRFLSISFWLKFCRKLFSSTSLHRGRTASTPCLGRGYPVASGTDQCPGGEKKWITKTLLALSSRSTQKISVSDGLPDFGRAALVPSDWLHLLSDVWCNSEHSLLQQPCPYCLRNSYRPWNALWNKYQFGSWFILLNTCAFGWICISNTTIHLVLFNIDFKRMHLWTSARLRGFVLLALNTVSFKRFKWWKNRCLHMFCVSHFRGALFFGASALLEQKIAFVYVKCSRRVRLQRCLAAVLQRLVWLKMRTFAVLSIALKFPCPEACDGVCSLQRCPSKSPTLGLVPAVL